MCGIAGIFNQSKPVDKSILVKMSEILNHRGPDDKGEYLHDNIGLAHRRLSIIDLKNGHQPMLDSTGRYCIIFNGEIYNYLELRQELIDAGYSLKTHSDTEVLLYLFIKEGKDCLKKLIGMFAFAIYDQETRTLFLARDHFGIKPLYYAECNDAFVFASEIKSLLCHPSIKAKPNQGALYEYITFQFCLDNRTLFHGIRKLEPANYMVVKQGKITEKKAYWSVDFTVDYHHTQDYFLERLAFLLQDSVRLQLRSDVPLGAYLSGGFDSSTVTTYAAELMKTSIATFTGGFKEGPQYDETAYAKAVSKQAKTMHYEIFPTAKDFTDTIENLIYYMDEPAAGPGLFPQYFVSKLASQKVKVVLGGQGGDEIFGGYARYLVAYLEQCIKSAIYEQQEEGKYVVTLETIIPNLALLKEYAPLIKRFWSQGLFEPMDTRYFQLINRSSDLKGIYTNEFQKEFDYKKIFDTFSTMFNSPQTKSYFNKMTYFDMRTLLPALLQVEDRMSMAVSLESRVPLLDHRIVELVASMPPTLKFADGKTKHVLRMVAQGKLPKEIVERKDKMGFPVPLSEWLKKGIVRDFVLDIFNKKSCKERGILDTKHIETLLNSELPFGRGLWGALCLELWHQKFIDNEYN